MKCSKSKRVTIQYMYSNRASNRASPKCRRDEAATSASVTLKTFAMASSEYIV